MKLRWPLRQPPFSKRGVIQDLLTSLKSNNWSITETFEAGLLSYADILAARDGTNVYIKVSGEDAPLKHTEVSDLSRVTIGRDAHAAFAFGEAISPAARARAKECDAMLLPAGDSGKLFEMAASLRPRVVGSIDRLHKTGLILGWAKFSNGLDKVRLEAWSGQELVGSGFADIYREPLRSLGDGYYGYSITVSPISDYDTFLSQLTMKAFRGPIFIGYLSKSSEMHYA